MGPVGSSFIYVNLFNILLEVEIHFWKEKYTFTVISPTKETEYGHGYRGKLLVCLNAGRRLLEARTYVLQGPKDWCSTFGWSVY